MVDVVRKDAFGGGPAAVAVTNTAGGQSAALAVVQVGADGVLVTPSSSAQMPSSLGSKLASQSLSITPASDAVFAPTAFSATVVSSAAQFTRPADTTAYASGDLVANSVTAGSVVPLSFTNASRQSGTGGLILGARLKKSTTTTANTDFRLHLYSATVTVANGDNAAWSSNGAANYMGSIDFATANTRAFTDGAANAAATASGPFGKAFKLSSGSTVFGLLEARAAYAPGNAETFIVSLEIQQD